MLRARALPHALPLARTVPGRILPWLVGGLVFASVVMAALAIMADQALLALRERAQLLTVTLPPADDGRNLDAALDALYRSPAVLAATPIGDDDLRALIRPWLGASGAIGDLPLPAMIDVRLDPLAAPDLAALQAALGAAVPGATLAIGTTSPDRAERLAALVRNLTAGLVVLALPAGLLAIGALAALGMRLCRDAVDLLRWMGAAPGYLAGQIERHALGCGLRGGAIGLGLALAAVVGLQAGLRPIADTVPIGLRPLDGLLLACLAAIIVLLALAVVRTVALYKLQQAGSRRRPPHAA